MSAAIARTRSAGLVTLLIAYAAFIVLGLPDGLLGVAWPSIQRTFSVPLDAFGLLLLPGTIGYMLASTFSGRVIGRWGIAAFLLGGVAIRALGLLGYVGAPGWALLLLANFVNGIGTGGVDSGFNTYIATNYSAGRMSWLHACFGVGATIGPLIMTAILTSGRDWQTGYLIVAALQGLIALLVLGVFNRWQIPGNGDSAEAHGGAVPARATLAIPAVWLAIGTFFLYTGMEITGGNWTYTLFTEGRGITPSVAGTWISLYWGSLTAGRILSGLIVGRLGEVRLLRWSMIGAAIGAALLIVRGAAAINLTGLMLTGFALAAIFPTLISITPARFGAAHAANAIGFQIAAAGLGVALLPGLAGVLAGRAGLETIAPFLLVIGLLQWALYEIGLRYAPIHGRGEQPAPE
ncbi:MAG: MFS transporter [Anaerolineae bacterium]|nr:MFS transporter [Anaerolineae bacterium]